MKIKDVIWVGQSKKDLMDLSDEARDGIGYGLYFAQCGLMHHTAKALKGFGSADVLEIIDTDAAGTYRAVYTVKFADFIYVLHVFQKKSKQGIKTPQQDIELIHKRLKRAEELHKERLHRERK